jgi:hypothetical protein
VAPLFVGEVAGTRRAGRRPGLAHGGIRCVQLSEGGGAGEGDRAGQVGVHLVEERVGLVSGEMPGDALQRRRPFVGRAVAGVGVTRAGVVPSTT